MLVTPAFCGSACLGIGKACPGHSAFASEAIDRGSELPFQEPGDLKINKLSKGCRKMRVSVQALAEFGGLTAPLSRGWEQDDRARQRLECRRASGTQPR